ncbi:MAG: hypothetical protein WD530_05780, partial [Vicingaceae bacterium]
CLGIYACEKESDFPDQPILKSRSFNRLTIDSAVWRIGFTDGDGDLGVRKDRNDSDNFFVSISIYKNGLIDTVFEGENYRIPVVEGIRTAAGVEGEIAFKIDGIDFLRAEGFDSLKYSGYAVDRSGKKSNTVHTPIFRTGTTN